MSTFRRIVGVLLVLLFTLISFVWLGLGSSVRAVLGRCEASVTPSSIVPNSNGSLSFTINNTGQADIVWVKITSPSGNFTITSGTKSGWSASVSGSSVTFTGGTHDLGESEGYQVSVTAAGETAQASWTVQASDSASGVGALTCSGSTGVAISTSSGDNTPPNITSGITVSTGDTTATLSWTTNEAAISDLDYGITTDYDDSVSEESATSNHSVTLSSLLASTTYNFSIISTDVYGNSSVTNNYTFATSTGTTTIAIPLTTTVTVTATESGPSITSISASVSYTQATITWTTNVSSDSQVEYGLTSTYGQSSSLATSRVTSHSVAISDLKTNTTYHYQVKSKIASGNLTISADKTFTTKKAPPPVVSLADKDEKITSDKAPKITGSVNSILASQVEISLDGGTTWIAVDKQVSGSRDFSYTPSGLEDDNYTVIARAIDIEDQEGESKSFVLVVDTLPPHVGGTSFFLGHQKLFPNQAGILVVSQGAKLSVVMSVIGGPTMVQVKTSENTQSLSRISGANLWKGEVSFENAGDFDIEVVSKDGAGNEVTQSIGKVNVLPKGSVVDENGNPVERTEVSIFTKIENPASFVKEEWQLWEAGAFDQENSQTTGQDGTFYYLVPRGTYYLEVKKDGFRSFVSKPFTLESAGAINPKIVFESLPGINISGKQFNLPWFLDILAKKSKIALEASPGAQTENPEIGKQAADFSLPTTLGGETSLSNFSGRKVLLTFWSTWDPSSTEQIAILDKLEEPKGTVLLPVALQESEVSIKSYLGRGAYLIDSLVDENGELLENYQVLVLPQHYLIDEDGIVKKVEAGVLSKEELINLISK